MKLYQVYLDANVKDPYVKHQTYLVVAKNEDEAIQKAFESEDYQYFDLEKCYKEARHITEVNGYEVVLGKKKELSKEEMKMLNELL